MAFNKEVNDRMEEAARRAYDSLAADMEKMTPTELKGAERVIEYMRANYMTAGYKKLARKLVQQDIDA